MGTCPYRPAQQSELRAAMERWQSLPAVCLCTRVLFKLRLYRNPEFPPQMFATQGQPPPTGCVVDLSCYFMAESSPPSGPTSQVTGSINVRNLELF